MSAAFTLHASLPEARRAEAARLYWAAFGGKLGPVMAPEAKALAYIERVLRPDHAVAALAEDGSLLGVAGYKTPAGAFVGGGPDDLRAVYGRVGALWRAGLLSLLAHDTDNERFLIDGIAVRADARGRGVGAALIGAVCEEARLRGYRLVRLDVVSGNFRARALYERLGFAACGTVRSRLAGAVFGIESATIMVRAL